MNAFFRRLACRTKASASDSLTTSLLCLATVVMGGWYVGSTPAIDKEPTSLLWQISGNGLSKPSYVYGTIHAICGKDVQQREALLTKLNQTEQLALELNMADPQLTSQLQQQMVMPNGVTLQQLLPATSYKQVAGFYKDSLGIDLAQAGVIKPIFLSAAMYGKLLGCQPEAFDMLFLQEGIKAQKPVVGLETLEAELKAVDQIPAREQAELLARLVQNYSRTQQDFQALILAYKAQDLQQLYKLIRASELGMEKYERVLIQDRNLAWAPVVAKLIQNKATFIAVGAAHLPGDEGLLALLRKAGYTVQPVVLN